MRATDADAAAEPVRLITSDGVALAARYLPAVPGADAVVVAHGFTLSSANPQVRRVCAGLHRHGFAVLCPDLRGHGGSGGRCTAGADEIHDVAAAVALLRERGAHRVAVLGWSMGGTSVLRHAGLGGDADAVVSVSAPGMWWERGTRPMRLVHWLFEHRTGRFVARRLRHVEIAADTWSDEVPAAPAEVAGAIAPRPLLLVHGELDHYFPARHIEALAAAAPTATVWREPGMGHAETATDDALLARIAAWTHEALDGPHEALEGADRARADTDAAGLRRWAP